MKFSILGHCGSREWLRTISYSSFNLLSIWTFSLLQNIFKGKWNKQITIAFVEFGLEFNLEKIILNKLASFRKILIFIKNLPSANGEYGEKQTILPSNTKCWLSGLPKNWKRPTKWLRHTWKNPEKISELRNLEFRISFFHNFYLINFILIWTKIF